MLVCVSCRLLVGNPALFQFFVRSIPPKSRESQGLLPFRTGPISSLDLLVRRVLPVVGASIRTDFPPPVRRSPPGTMPLFPQSRVPWSPLEAGRGMCAVIT